MGQTRVLGREDAVRQRPDDQGEDGDQAPVQPNLDAAEPPDREVPVHPALLALRSAARTAESFAGHGDLLSSSLALVGHRLTSPTTAGVRHAQLRLSALVSDWCRGLFCPDR